MVQIQEKPIHYKINTTINKENTYIRVNTFKIKIT